MSVRLADVNAAFYRTPYLGPYRIRLPPYMPHGECMGSDGRLVKYGPGTVLYPTRVIPGVPEGPAVFINTFAEELEKRGYTRVLPGLFGTGTRLPVLSTEGEGLLPITKTGPFKFDSLISAFVDDVTLVSLPAQEDAIVSHINAFTQLDDPIHLPTSESTLYVGWDIAFTPNGNLTVEATSFLASIAPIIPPSTRPFFLTAMEELASQFAKHIDVSRPYTPQEKEEAEEWVGYLGWLSSITPEAAMHHQLLSRLISRDPERATRLCQSILLKASQGSTPLTFTPLPLRVALLVYTDASYYKEHCGYYGVAIKLVAAPEEGISGKELP